MIPRLRRVTACWPLNEALDERGPDRCSSGRDRPDSQKLFFGAPPIEQPVPSELLHAPRHQRAQRAAAPLDDLRVESRLGEPLQRHLFPTDRGLDEKQPPAGTQVLASLGRDAVDQDSALTAALPGTRSAPGRHPVGVGWQIRRVAHDRVEAQATHRGEQVPPQNLDADAVECGSQPRRER